VIEAAHLRGWVDVPLRDRLQGRFNAPVRVDNDANMAALGERWLGSARDIDDFVFIAIGAGVGAGVVVGGRLHRGHHWYAGEISRMNLDHRDWQVDFGQSGYLEQRVGAGGPSGWKAVFDDVRRGNAAAQAVVDELAIYLGTAVGNITTVLDRGNADIATRARITEDFAPDDQVRQRHERGIGVTRVNPETRDLGQCFVEQPAGAAHQHQRSPVIMGPVRGPGCNHGGIVEHGSGVDHAAR